MDYRFIPLSEADPEAWDSFVEQNPWAWPGHRRAMVEVEEKLGHSACPHLVLDKKERIVAVVPLFKIVTRCACLFRVQTLVSGTQLRGGPLIARELAAKRRRGLWGEMASWLQELALREGIDRVQLSFPHMMGEEHNSAVYPYHPLRDWGAQEMTNLSLISDLRPDEKTMIGKLCGSQRQWVHKAERANPEFFEITDRASWLAAYPLNLATYGKEGVTPYTEDQLALIWNRFVETGCGYSFGVRYKGELVHAVLTTGTPHAQYVWMAFNCFPRLLEGGCQYTFWQTMRALKAKGVKWMELGTLEFGDHKMEGIGEFKRRFGCTVFRSLDGVLDFRPMKSVGLSFVQTAAHCAKTSKLYRSCNLFTQPLLAHRHNASKGS